MAIPVAPFPCPDCGYTVVYHRTTVEDGIDYHVMCLAVSCDYKEDTHAEAETSPHLILAIVGNKYRSGIPQGPEPTVV